ncbi:hypothetical protein [Clostridium tagluense]|uniref:hypothetical protein n=1 Tax=Clostridium tagluense TaxID=360422 RepID=UPI001CF5321A|nr:hypothetical protein [Clostridium tagluense]MCB2300447.1 hypothetical protein [Clostridium tagluense]
MAKKIYDVTKVLYLYEKYGTLTAVHMRLGYAPSSIKKILAENGVELKKYVPARWDINQIFQNNIG